MLRTGLEQKERAALDYLEELLHLSFDEKSMSFITRQGVDRAHFSSGIQNIAKRLPSLIFTFRSQRHELEPLTNNSVREKPDFRTIFVLKTGPKLSQPEILIAFKKLGLSLNNLTGKAKPR